MDTERAPSSAGTGRLARAAIVVLRFYQRWISPMFPPTCRFYPSCSAYAVEALRIHGFVRGAGLTLVRLAKCAPWHPGGLDPVPPRACRHPEPPRPDPSGNGADHPRTTPDAGVAAPITEEQASC